MRTRAITIHVDTKAAQAYELATAEEQRKLDALLSLKLIEVARESRPLEEVMSEISLEAQERGMTPEILKEILNER